METRLDRLHRRAAGMAALGWLAVVTRVLLAIGFIPSGLKKLVGERFTLIGPDNLIGFFFDAFYQTGFYYQFVGAAQVVAGLLLLVPRTATLGAVLYFPIIVNIFVITVSLEFRGTPLITGLMVLGNLFLLCWDYPRFRPLLAGSSVDDRQPLRADAFLNNR